MAQNPSSEQKWIQKSKIEMTSKFVLFWVFF